MAKVTRRRLVPETKHANRRAALDKVLKNKVSTTQELLAAVADYVRSVFHRVDPDTAREIAHEWVEMADRKAGEHR